MPMGLSLVVVTTRSFPQTLVSLPFCLALLTAMDHRTVYSGTRLTLWVFTYNARFVTFGLELPRQLSPVQ